jgi:hypothetical protein
MSIFTKSQIVLKAQLQRDHLCILPIDTDIPNIVVVKPLDLDEDSTTNNTTNTTNNTPTKYIFQYNIQGVLDDVPVLHSIK